MSTHSYPAHTASGADDSRHALLTIPEVIAEIRVARATFYRWRQLRKGPRSIKLPNGDVRIRRSELERWLASLEDVHDQT